jgi:hypothetical protein
MEPSLPAKKARLALQITMMSPEKVRRLLPAPDEETDKAYRRYRKL